MTGRCFFIGTTLADNPVPQHFTALANELVRRGHRVVILAPHRVVELENHTSNPAIYVWPSQRPTKLADALFLQRLIRKYRPDCLIANFVAVNVMMLVGRWAGVRRRIAWYHTLSAQVAVDSQMAPWVQRFLHWRKSFVYRACTQVVPVSAAAGGDFAAVYPRSREKVHVCLNALADPQLPAQPGEAARLVCVARLNFSKGQDVLIRAVARLREKHPTVRVEFIGEGPALDSLRGLAQELKVTEQCEFVGRVAHDVVLQRMSRATATVIPSRSEAFGLVTIESLAVGTPVVASNVGGLPEIVRDGVDGFLVPSEDSGALAEALGRVLADPAGRAEMRRQARERFLTTFEQRKAVMEQASWLEALTR